MDHMPRTQITTVTANIAGHGEYVVTSAAFDAAIAHYLPASPSKLRTICEERADEDFGNVYDVSSFLTMLADWDYNVDDSPLSIDAAHQAASESA